MTTAVSLIATDAAGVPVVSVAAMDVVVGRRAHILTCCENTPLNVSVTLSDSSVANVSSYPYTIFANENVVGTDS